MRVIRKIRLEFAHRDESQVVNGHVASCGELLVLRNGKKLKMNVIEVVHGAEAQRFLAGRSVEYLRGYLKHVLNIPVDADPRINGKSVGGEYITRAGETLEFIKTDGRKGLFYTEAELVQRGFDPSAIDAFCKDDPDQKHWHEANGERCFRDPIAIQWLNKYQRHGKTPDSLWSKPDSPSQWARKFGVSVSTIMRRFKDQKIRNKKLSTKSYAIHINDLPH